MNNTNSWNAQIFAARIRPHRSLSQQNFRLLLILFCAVAFFTTLPFLILGAWPVVGFMGLDVLLFWWAFRVNFRDARAYEDVSVTPLELKLAKVSPDGARAEWCWNPIWVRLVREEDEDYGLTRVALVSRNHEVEVAGFLGPAARAEFAAGLSQALTEAKRGPRFS
ncbi:MAG: DUF2244 domain-containing protein [Beijerinckiaceae bacterium]|nr:DUF2244 domain-containing protein [Beijerinckiaceae bacterium]